MKFALDTEFIDTPIASELISMALVSYDGRELYMEFEFTKANLTPWLRENVVPHLIGGQISFSEAEQLVMNFVGGSRFEPPEFWGYFAAYDWYWFCRLFGGMMFMPDFYPHFCHDFVHVGRPPKFGREHFALDDARNLMAAIRHADIRSTQGKA
jgi:hypothetical protein